MCATLFPAWVWVCRRRWRRYRRRRRRRWISSKTFFIAVEKNRCWFFIQTKKNREKQNSFLKRKKSLSKLFSTEEPKLVQMGIFVFMIMGQRQHQQHQQQQHHGCEQIFLDLATDSSRCLTSPRWPQVGRKCSRFRSSRRRHRRPCASASASASVVTALADGFGNGPLPAPKLSQSKAETCHKKSPPPSTCWERFSFQEPPWPDLNLWAEFFFTFQRMQRLTDRPMKTGLSSVFVFFCPVAVSYFSS